MFDTISRKFSEFVTGTPTPAPTSSDAVPWDGVGVLRLTGFGSVRGFDGSVLRQVFMTFEVTPVNDKNLMLTGRFTLDGVSHRFDMAVRPWELFDTLQRLTA